MKNRIILDLCSGSGSWSQPYVDAGYQVERIDLPTDIRLLNYPGAVHGILAAPPCTVFASSGARWPRTEDDFMGGLSIVDACLRVVVLCQPHWWALENPIGRLPRWLGKPRMYFDPCDYGDPYTKKTALWGVFVSPRRAPVEPTLGSWMHTGLSGRGEQRRGERSKTPPRFAQAFFEANP